MLRYRISSDIKLISKRYELRKLPRESYTYIHKTEQSIKPDNSTENKPCNPVTLSRRETERSGAGDGWMVDRQIGRQTSETECQSETETEGQTKKRKREAERETDIEGEWGIFLRCKIECERRQRCQNE